MSRKRLLKILLGLGLVITGYVISFILVTEADTVLMILGILGTIWTSYEFLRWIQRGIERVNE